MYERLLAMERKDALEFLRSFVRQTFYDMLLESQMEIELEELGGSWPNGEDDQMTWQWVREWGQ
jgi:hypothetical protein